MIASWPIAESRGGDIEAFGASQRALCQQRGRREESRSAHAGATEGVLAEAKVTGEALLEMMVALCYRFF